MTAPSNLGPWQRIGATAQRRDPQGRTGAMVTAPGDADQGRWGWFAMAPDGRSQGGKVPGGEDIARARADAALEELAGGAT